VFGYFACDLELGSVEMLQCQRDGPQLDSKESVEKSELIQQELMEVKSQRDDFEMKLKESTEII
jgi:hypothetical protein